MKNIIVFLGALLLCVAMSNAQTQDNKLGTIKVRKYEEQQFYLEIDYVPEYLNGADALIDDIQAGIIYPEEATAKGLSGTVLVKVVIDHLGNVINTKIHLSPYEELNSAALKSAKSLKKFQPHLFKEKPVSSQFILPIKFIL